MTALAIMSTISESIVGIASSSCGVMGLPFAVASLGVVWLGKEIALLKDRLTLELPKLACKIISIALITLGTLAGLASSMVVGGGFGLALASFGTIALGDIGTVFGLAIGMLIANLSLHAIIEVSKTKPHDQIQLKQGNVNLIFV